MAARIRKTHQDDIRFYVYRFIDADGVVAYVGKGSGRRFSSQFNKLDMTGDIVSWHKKESDAYAAEVSLISELSPYMNKYKGGNGAKATQKKKARKDKFYLLCEKIGTKAVAARILLNFRWLVDSSKVDMIRRVAYG